ARGLLVFGENSWLFAYRRHIMPYCLPTQRFSACLPFSKIATGRSTCHAIADLCSTTLDWFSLRGLRCGGTAAGGSRAGARLGSIVRQDRGQGSARRPAPLGRAELPFLPPGVY